MPDPTPPFHMPAEWEPHAGTWLAWPHRRTDWPGKFAPVRWVYGEIVRTLARTERVNVLVREPAQRTEARRVLGEVDADTTNVRYWEVANDRGWVRDNGPMFARDAAGGKVVVDWAFTGWGKYEDWVTDDRIARQTAAAIGVPVVRPLVRGWRTVLEGGSIDVSGDGLLLTTEECLLSRVQERNPPFDRADYEAVFRDFLGVSQTIWLGSGIAGDDTHGHVDDLARFVAPRTVVTVVEPNEADANFRPLRDNLDRLKAVRTADGGSLTVVELPMPAPLVFDGLRLPASYANFYIANGVVIVPTFNDPADRVALGVLADVFPGRQVVGIHCVDLVWGLGTLHCMTQQEPV